MCVCTESRLFFFLSSSLNETNTRSQFIYSGSEAVLDWPLLSKPSCEAVCMEVAVLIMSIFIAFWPSHEPKLNCGQKIDTKSSKHFFKTVLRFLFGFFFLYASSITGTEAVLPPWSPSDFDLITWHLPAPLFFCPSSPGLQSWCWWPYVCSTTGSLRM